MARTHPAPPTEPPPHPTGGPFADPLGGLPDQAWDALAGDRFYSSAFWLRLCAFEGGGTSGALHVDVPGGRAAVPLIAVGDDPHPNCRWGDLLTARGLPAPPPRGLLVGQRRGYLAQLLTSPGTDLLPAAGAVLDAVRAARSSAPVDDGARVALYLTTPDVEAFRAAGVRALPVALATDAWIAVPPGGFDAWLAGFGRRRRQSIRREAEAFERVGYRLERRPLAQAYRDVARLAVNTERRYGRDADPDTYAEAFRLQGEFAGARAQVLLCGPDGEQPLACCLYYPYGDTLYLRAAGFDYDRLRGVEEYFNLAYYQQVRLPGVRRLHAGTGTPDGKAQRGATLDPLWLLDLSHDSVLAGIEGQVRAHNRAYRDGLAAMSAHVARALDPARWDPFC